MEKPEPFSVGKGIVKNFIEEAGSSDCESITDKKFSDWRNFQDHMVSSAKCQHLISFVTNQASEAIKECSAKRMMYSSINRKPLEDGRRTGG